MNDCRRYGGCGLRRPLRDGSSAAADEGSALASRILGVSGSMSVRALFLTHTDNLTLVSGDASVWADLSGNDYDATQGTASARPTYNATGLSSGPALEFDAARYMQTASIDIDSDDCYAHIAVVKTDASGGIKVIADFGTYTTTGFAHLQQAADYRGEYDDGTTNSSARSNGGSTNNIYTTARVATTTVDTGLASSEVTVWLDSVNVVNVRPADNDSGAIGDQVLTIGAKGNGGDKFNGAIAAVVFLSGTSLDLTQIGGIESELSSALSAGDYDS